MLTPQQAALESTAEKIARIITRQYGVTVRVEGSMAYIDLENKVIVLPNLVGDALEKVGRVMDGFLDHECGHAIFTDVVASREVKGNKTLFQIWTTIEDVWTEREMGKKYVGCGQNLQILNEAVMAEIAKQGEADPFQRILLGMHECWRGAATPEQFEADPDIGLLFQALRPEVELGYGVKSTQGAVDLAKQILEKLQELSDGEDGEGGGEGESEGEQNQGAEEPQDGQQDAQGNPSPGPSRTQGPGQPPLKQGPQGQPPQSEVGKEDLQRQAKVIQDKIDQGETTAPMDAEGYFNDCLPDTPSKAACGDPDEYLVFSEEFDTEVHYTAAQRLHWSGTYRQLREEVHSYLGNLSSALEAALAAESEARWVGGARRGRKFDRRVFPAWIQAGRDDRIYRQKEQHEDWDTAVSLLWDCSGSMQIARPGSKSYLARMAALAFHEALSRARIMHEVLGFNTGGRAVPELRQRIAQAKAHGQDLDAYSRLDDTDKRMVFVPWGSTDGRAICAINGDYANRDGECVMWAAKRLAVRPEKRKVLIVGSDGRPSGALWGYTEEKYLQDVVAQVIDAGIEVYAIGIMDKSVRKYYPHWVIINRIEDLPGAVMRQLAQALFARKGTDHGSISAVKRPTH